MPLMDELREIASKLDAFDVPSSNEQPAILGALIYWIDERLNLERLPAKADESRQPWENR